MQNLPMLAALAALTIPLSAQDDQKAADAAAQRVLNGGTFFEPKWRRADDGMLELEFFADSGLPERAHFVPLLGKDLVDGFTNCGAIGWLSMWCHGNGDLLSMTDAEFHLRCLGIDVGDAGLRQYLALPLPAFDGPRGRAELFDRMLAIDLLRRRGCKPAAVELMALAGRKDAPAPLRERALSAIAALNGAEAPQPRRNLDPATLPLPAAFDGCLVIDHQQLPDLGWLTALGRRLGMLVTARTVIQAGGSVSPAMCNGAQRLADIVSELPFGLALQFGNVRLDQSCIVVTAKADAEVPVAITWSASGSLESERWQRATLPPAVMARDRLLRSGELQVAPESLWASTDGSKGRPRPEMAGELLRPTGAALRVVIPQNSKLWVALAFLQLPPAKGAELLVGFRDVGKLVLTVTARDEDAAAAWEGKGRELLQQGERELSLALQHQLQQSEDLRALVQAVFGATLAVDGDQLTVKVEIRGFDRHRLQTMLEALAR